MEGEGQFRPKKEKLEMVGGEWAWFVKWVKGGLMQQHPLAGGGSIKRHKCYTRVAGFMFG